MVSGLVLDGTEYGDAWSECRTSCDGLVYRARALLAETSKISDECSRAGFREWVRGDGSNDSKHAFQFSRLPAQWCPDPVQSQEACSHDSIGRLDAERIKYSKLWKAENSDGEEFAPAHGSCNSDIALPPLTAAILREAARTFSHGTSCSYDGFHPRHWDLVCDEGLEVFATLIMACEELGVWPDSLRAVVITLIPKPKGGSRPIGLFNGTHRLWTRARKDVATQWETENACGIFAAASGQAATDTVWAQSLRAEQAVGHDHVAAAALFDLKSFFDTLQHDHLATRARIKKFPRKLARLGIDAYKAPRYVQRGGCVAAPLFPSRGVVAGCGFATTFVKIACFDVFTRLQHRHPNVRFDAYIDDITITAEGSEADVLRWVTAAAHEFVAEMQTSMGCEIAWEKAAVVSNSETLANRVRHAIGIPTISQPTAVNLGVDFGCGLTRKKWGKSSNRKVRLKAANRRKGRLHVLRLVLGGKRASLIASAGVLSAAIYGAPVNGFSDSELQNLRRLAATAMTPTAQGRSLTALMLVRGDPTWSAAVAPIAQWVRAAWAAEHDPVCVGRGIDVEFLSKAWHEGRASRHSNLVSPVGKARWQRVKGPVDALELSMHRLAWTASGPFSWTDDLGIQRQVLEHSPVLWKIYLKEAIHRMHERELATRLVDVDGSSFGRACTDVLKSTLALKAVPAVEKEALASAGCNSIWTLVDAQAAGYLVDSTSCPLCGCHPDTLFGRVWVCSHPSVVEVRNLHASSSVRSAALAAGDASCLFTHGIIPHPADYLPPREPSLQFQAFQDGQRLGSHRDIDMGGDLYVDGSCDQNVIRELRKAAFSVVAYNSDGVETGVFIAAVPPALPQSAQSAEYSAAAAACTLAKQSFVLFGDCLNVVKHWSQEGNKKAWAKQAYGGLFTSTACSGASRFLDQFVKVKAHQDIENVRVHGAPDEYLRARGNDRADVWAKTGIALHGGHLADEARVSAVVKLAKAVCRTLAAVLPLFPVTELVRPSDALAPAEKKRKKTGKWPANRKTAVRLGVKHMWVQRTHRWQCEVCLGNTNNLVLSKAREGESCKGRRDVATTVEQPDLGHTVVQFCVQGSPLFVCRGCGGCFARNGGGKLAELCEEPTKWGKQVLKRVFTDGVHPVSRVRFDDRADSGLLGAAVSDTLQVPSEREATVRKLAKRTVKNSKQWQSKLPADAFETLPVVNSAEVFGARDDPSTEEEDAWGNEPEDPWADDPPGTLPIPATLPDLGAAHASSSRSLGADSVGPPSVAGSSQDLLVPSVDEHGVTGLMPTSVDGFVAFSVEERTFTKSADDLAKLKVAALRAKKLGSHAT